jgi:hypothetical protein
MAFSFKFSADGSEFTRGLHKMKSEVKSFAMSAGKIMAGMLAAGAVVGLKRMVDQLDRVGKLSARIGKSAESLQKVAFAANLAGTDVENVANALTKIEQNAGQAMNGLTTYSDAFERLNVDYTTFAQLSPEDQILEMAAAYQKAKKEGTGMADVLTIIGGRAKELLPLLSQSPEDLAATFNSANVASESMIKNAERLNDAFTTLKNKGFGVVVWFIDIIKEAGTGLAVQMTVVEESVRLVLNEIALVGKVLELATKGDWGGVKASFRQMKAEGEKTFDSISKRIDGIHEAKRVKGKRAGGGGLSGAGADSVIAEEKARAKAIKDVEKLEKEIAATERKMRMDRLSDEEKQKKLQTEKAETEKKFLRLRSDALDNELEGGERKSALYIKELEAQKELLRVTKELAGVESKIAASKAAEKDTFKASLGRTSAVLSQESDGLKSELSQGQGNLENLKGQGVESSVITSGLRSIGGGGSAKVTRDPAMQIAKRSQSILAQIAKNTATQANLDVIKSAQKEVAAFNKEH